MTYLFARDPNGDLFTAFGGFGMRTTIFIDANGAVVNRHTGAFTFDGLRALIKTHLGV